MSTIKSGIKKLLIGNQQNIYKKALKSKKMDYEKWVHAVEQQSELKNPLPSSKKKSLTIDIEKKLDEGFENENDGELAKSSELCQLFEILDNQDEGNCQPQYMVVPPKCLPKVCEMLKTGEIKVNSVILKLCDGELAKNAVSKIHQEFSKNKSLILIYSDEDVLLDGKKRENPWFKPDWAPDDFLSYFYFGSLVALRADVLSFLPMKEEDDIYRYIYRVLFFSGAFCKHESLKNDESADANTHLVGHISEILFHTYGVSSYETVKKMTLKDVVTPKIDNMTVSVIIPSKDHPDILFRCIDSFINVTRCNKLKYEFIVVDNGSNDINRRTIEDLKDNYAIGENLTDFKYIYEERPFNFSYMCNLGAKNATGRLLLFLNDDMEIIDSSWLSKMCMETMKPYAGAVGAKLLYPRDTERGSNIIQHAGITNLRIGPAHKLQFLSDREDHYFGRNRYVHDMMGVTGACLMLRREVFEEAGGFDENLAVAFNDVDLCYTIHELGYYNIERNDIKLLHHESLSRGNDSDSKDKMLRLSKEKDYLYEKHQSLYGKDPFYNENLTTDMLEVQYAPKYHYEVKLDLPWAEVSDMSETIANARKDRCVRVGMEAAMDIYKWKYGVSMEKGKTDPTEEDLGFYFQGYTFVIGANNACYSRILLLQNTDTSKVYGIKVNVEVRPDIENNIPDQVNVGMTGYTAKLKADVLPKGHYRFGMYMKDNTSSQRLYNWSNWTLEV